MMGVAPPMPGGASQTPGPAKSARDKMMQAARLLFDAIAEEPKYARDLNDIIESLTTVLHQSAEAPAISGEGPEGLSGPPGLDRTPLGPPPGGNAMASAVGASGVHPAMLLSRLMGKQG